MFLPTKEEWSRFHQLKDDLSHVARSRITEHIERYKRDGEDSTVIDLLERFYKLPEQPVLGVGSRLADHYTITRKVGEGGMGFVYAAVQEYTRQEVAIKVIHPSLVSPSLKKRFRDEIQTLGRLKHRNIVQVFDADSHREASSGVDTLFYAMQLVDGRPLSEWIKNGHPKTDVRLECFAQICDAVDHAHRNGVIHRDLKPDIHINERYATCYEDPRKTSGFDISCYPNEQTKSTEGPEYTADLKSMFQAVYARRNRCVRTLAGLVGDRNAFKGISEQITRLTDAIDHLEDACAAVGFDAEPIMDADMYTRELVFTHAPMADSREEPYESSFCFYIPVPIPDYITKEPQLAA